MPRGRASIPSGNAGLGACPRGALAHVPAGTLPRPAGQSERFRSLPGRLWAWRASKSDAGKHVLETWHPRHGFSNRAAARQRSGV
eukprot:scaffold1027_cov413-Prasinococcus_capsulatus_cf.AAC.12